MTLQGFIAAPGCGCDHADVAAGLWPVDDALAFASDLLAPVNEVETIPLASASGRVLADDIRAASDAPRFNTSAVDGYAVSTAGLSGDGPWDIEVTGRIAAGDPTASGSANAGVVQIFTGARLPDAFDAVIMQEKVNRSGSRIVFSGPVAAGLNLRKAGEEYRQGSVLLRAGTVLGPIEIGCAAAAGVGQIKVRRKLRVALVVTGSELKTAGDNLEGSQIWDVNTPMMQSVLGDPTLEITQIVHISDSCKNLAHALEEMALSCDVVVVSGGASVGEEDHLHRAISDAGGVVSFSGVAIKPGKPVTFGTLGQTLLIGLPGNPVAAFVTWMVLGRPVVGRLGGNAGAPALVHHVKAGHALRHKLGRCEFRPARITGYDGRGIDVIEAADATHSGRITSLLGAAGLVRIPAYVESVAPGDLLEFIPF